MLEIQEAVDLRLCAHPVNAASCLREAQQLFPPSMRCPLLPNDQRVSSIYVHFLEIKE